MLYIAQVERLYGFEHGVPSAPTVLAMHQAHQDSRFEDPRFAV